MPKGNQIKQPIEDLILLMQTEYSTKDNCILQMPQYFFHQILFLPLVFSKNFQFLLLWPSSARAVQMPPQAINVIKRWVSLFCRFNANSPLIIELKKASAADVPPPAKHLPIPEIRHKVKEPAFLFPSRGYVIKLNTPPQDSDWFIKSSL